MNKEIIEKLSSKRFLTNYCIKPKPVVILDDAFEALATLETQHEQKLREQREEIIKKIWESDQFSRDQKGEVQNIINLQTQ